MKRTSTLWQILVLSLMASAASVHAQTTTPLPGEAPPPPRMEQLEEMTDDAVPTAITPRVDSPTTITERREQGRVTEIKVNSNGSTYYLRPNSPSGSSLPGDMTSGNNRGPQWTLFEFDMGSTKTQPKVPDTTDSVPAPVPPPPR
jgi:hypothetical protein